MNLQFLLMLHHDQIAFFCTPVKVAQATKANPSASNVFFVNGTKHRSDSKNAFKYLPGCYIFY